MVSLEFGFPTRDEDRNSIILNVLETAGIDISSYNKESNTLKVTVSDCKNRVFMQKVIMIHQTINFADLDFVFWNDLDSLARCDFRLIRNRRTSLFALISMVKSLPEDDVSTALAELIQNEIDDICSPEVVAYDPESCAEEREVFKTLHARYGREMVSAPTVFTETGFRGVVALRDLKPGEPVFQIDIDELCNPRSALHDPEFAAVSAFILAESPLERQLLLRDVVAAQREGENFPAKIFDDLVEKIASVTIEPDWSTILYFLHCRARVIRKIRCSKPAAEAEEEVKKVLGDTRGDVRCPANKCPHYCHVQQGDAPLPGTREIMARMMPCVAETLMLAPPEAHDALRTHVLGADELVTSVLGCRNELFRTYCALFPLLRIAWPELFACEALFSWNACLHVRNLLDSRSMNVEIPFSFDEASPFLKALGRPNDTSAVSSDRTPLRILPSLLSATPNEAEVRAQHCFQEFEFSLPGKLEGQYTIRCPLRCNTFVAVADFLNHRGRAPIVIPKFDPDSRCIHLEAKANVKKGAELFICYGMMQSWECLSNYGFVPNAEEEVDRMDLLELSFEPPVHPTTPYHELEAKRTLEERQVLANLLPEEEQEEEQDVAKKAKTMPAEPAADVVAALNSLPTSHLFRKVPSPPVPTVTLKFFQARAAKALGVSLEDERVEKGGLQLLQHYLAAICERLQTSDETLEALETDEEIIHMWVEAGWCGKIRQVVQAQLNIVYAALEFVATKLCVLKDDSDDEDEEDFDGEESE